MRDIIIVLLILMVLVNCSDSKKSNNNINNTKVVLNNHNDTVSVTHFDQNGVKEGVCRIYSNGIIDSIVTFRQGIMQGDYKVFYNNGILNEEGVFRNGKKHGWITNYDTSGVIISKTEFISYTDEKDSYVNQSVIYNENGDINLNQSSFFKIGQLENYTDTSKYFKIRIQLYSFVQNESDAQFLLSIDKNDSIEYKLNISGKYNKRDFVIPINNGNDSLSLNGYIQSRFGYNKVDSTFNEIIQVFKFKVSRLQMFNDLINPCLSNPPVDYDTLRIE